MAGIVVGVDGTPASRAALAWALRHGARTGTGVTAVHVWATPVELDLHVDDPLVADQPITFAAAAGSPGPALVDRARGADLLVVGAHADHEAVGAGAVASYCLHHSRTPVAVVPEDVAREVGGRRLRIVVGSDLSPEAAAGLRWAVRSADALGAEVVVALAWQGGAHQESRARSRLREFVAAALGPGGDVPVQAHADHGAPLDVLLHRARDADLLVLGSHGHRRLARLLGGSTSGQLGRLCRCPLVVLAEAGALSRG